MEKLMKKAACVWFSAVLACGLLPAVPSGFSASTSFSLHSAWADETSAETVSGDSVIVQDGAYTLSPGATGVVTVAQGVVATIVGSGTSAAANTNLTIVVGSGSKLTLRDVCVTNTADMSILDFQGTGELRCTGVCVLESTEYSASAAIHVGPDAQLTLADGGGALYLYKRTQGAGLGGNAEEANGRIEFAGGLWFIKGTKTGAVIGNDTCQSSSKEAQIGDIIFSGGQVYVEANAKGAAVGGSNMSGAGSVYLRGGQLSIWVDYAGAAIGAGATGQANGCSCGTFYYQSGSLKVYVNQNAAYQWGVTSAQLCDLPVTAAKVNDSGEPVVRYILDVTDIPANSQGAAYEVEVDGVVTYTGGLHGYTYTANTDSTEANWTVSSDDSALYLYVTPGEHEVSVNGSQAYTIQAEEPEYDDGSMEVPSSSWNDFADVSWYDAAASEFILSTPEQLAGLSALVAGTVEGVSQDSFEGKTVRLGADINLAAHAWTPIGYMSVAAPFSDSEYYTSPVSHAFQGTFDGAGYDISGILADGGTASSKYGLFGAASGATFTRVEVTRGYMNAYRYVGGVCGYAVNCTFSQCISGMTLHAASTGTTGGGYGGDYVGGICGYAADCAFTSCKNMGTLSSNRRSGGIAGAFSGTMTGCSSTGVIVTGNEFAAGMAAVVLASTSASTIKDCVNSGPVSGLTAGGIVSSTELSLATQSLTIASCVNEADIDCGSSGGGILGYTGERAAVSVEDCVNKGAIQGTRGDGSGVGGIVGEARCGSILNCSNYGEVSASDQVITNNFGGVLGYGYFNILTIEMRGCYNAGVVSASGKNAGGILGGMRLNTSEYSEDEARFAYTVLRWSDNLYEKSGASCGVGVATSRANVEGAGTVDVVYKENFDIEEKVQVASGYSLGDANNSGSVNIVDAQIAYDLARGAYASGQGESWSKYGAYPLPDGWTVNIVGRVCDVNADAVLDAADALAIQYYALFGTWS